MKRRLMAIVTTGMALAAILTVTTVAAASTAPALSNPTVIKQALSTMPAATMVSFASAFDASAMFQKAMLFSDASAGNEAIAANGPQKLNRARAEWRRYKGNDVKGVVRAKALAAVRLRRQSKFIETEIGVS